MAQPPSPEPRAAGAFIAITTIVGALIGVGFDQPSAGVVAGAGIGIAGAIVQWLRDRRRSGR